MAESPVDLSNLHVLTDNNPVFETELFTQFLDSAATCLLGMRRAFNASDEGAWRREAHALKGLSYNLGAKGLGDLCALAQGDNRAAEDDKAIMLKEIADELGRVGDYLVECIAAASSDHSQL